MRDESEYRSWSFQYSSVAESLELFPAIPHHLLSRYPHVCLVHYREIPLPLRLRSPPCSIQRSFRNSLRDLSDEHRMNDPSPRDSNLDDDRECQRALSRSQSATDRRVREGNPSLKLLRLKRGENISHNLRQLQLHYFGKARWMILPETRMLEKLVAMLSQELRRFVLEGKQDRLSQRFRSCRPYEVTREPVEAVQYSSEKPFRQNRSEFGGNRRERPAWVVASIQRTFEGLCDEGWELGKLLRHSNRKTTILEISSTSARTERTGVRRS